MWWKAGAACNGSELTERDELAADVQFAPSVLRLGAHHVWALLNYSVRLSPARARPAANTQHLVRAPGSGGACGSAAAAAATPMQATLMAVQQRDAEARALFLLLLRESLCVVVSKVKPKVRPYLSTCIRWRVVKSAGLGTS